MTDIFNLERILAELANDNEDALDELFEYYYPRLYTFSQSFLKLEEGIDDILQEVFLKIWFNRKKIRSAASFNSFLYSITRNHLLNELRNRLRYENAIEGMGRYVSAPIYHTSKEIEYLEIKEKVDEILQELPERQKQVFMLSRGEGLSYKEIADKLGLKPKTVEYHLSQALKHMKNKLQKFGLMSMLYYYLFF